MSVPLDRLFPGADDSILIGGMTLDSRQVQPGDLFIALPGQRHDGRAHIAAAIERGAVAVAYEAGGAESLVVEGAAAFPLHGLAAQLSAIAGRFFGEPSAGLRLIGVTGTNGKTSVTQLIAQALDRLGERCGLIGTLGNGFHGQLAQGLHTTPDAIGVQQALAALKHSGARSLAMEVSSHGLEQGRVAALDFNVAVFTNLSRDHLDYHGSMQAYGQAKAKLFERPELRCRVINLDDDFGRALAARPHSSALLTYSLSDRSASIHCTAIELSEQGVRASLVTPQGAGELRSGLLGRFNLSNLLAVVGALLALDYSLSDILAVLSALQGPEGRMQRLGGGQRPLVVVDYAHTPDALEKVLEALRPHARGRVFCLFGCGGDRDRGKRPLMAQVAERLADQVLVTDDNPRSEDPAAILAEIRAGFVSPDQVQFVPGRNLAIARIIAAAREGDVVLLAGKGHEDYQEIHGQRLPFSDIQEARKALDAWEAPHV